MVNAVNRPVNPHTLAYVPIEETEPIGVAEMLDVLQRSGRKVVNADDAVATR
jgi:hypothetical protein